MMSYDKYDASYGLSLLSCYLIIILKIADGVTTYIGVRIGYVETNIVLAKLFSYVGLGFGVLLSTVLTIVFYMIISSIMNEIINITYLRYLFNMFQYLVVISLLSVVINNIILIIWGV